MLIIPDLVNVTRYFKGMDNLERCKDKKHWLDYNKKITYKYIDIKPPPDTLSS